MIPETFSPECRVQWGTPGASVSKEATVNTSAIIQSVWSGSGSSTHPFPFLAHFSSFHLFLLDVAVGDSVYLLTSKHTHNFSPHGCCLTFLSSKSLSTCPGFPGGGKNLGEEILDFFPFG